MKLDFRELLSRELWLGGGEAKVLIQGSAPDRLSAFHVVALLPWTPKSSSARHRVFPKSAQRFFPILQAKVPVIEVAGRRWGIISRHKGRSMFIETQGSWISIQPFWGQYMEKKLLDFNNPTITSNMPHSCNERHLASPQAVGVHCYFSNNDVLLTHVCLVPCCDPPYWGSHFHTPNYC